VQPNKKKKKSKMSHHHHHPHHHKHRNALERLNTQISGLLAQETIVEHARPENAAGAWERLRVGNARFAAGELGQYLAKLAAETDPETRAELASGQHPFATVLTCSDSRVSPELLFDEGLGCLFVVRVAGNVVDPATLGSVEYGCEHLNTGLLIVLGHSSCGAVTAAMGPPSGDSDCRGVGSIIEKIIPSAQAAQAEFPADKDAALNSAIRRNVIQQKDALLSESPALRGLVAKGALTVMTAIYNISTGLVEHF